MTEENLNQEEENLEDIFDETEEIKPTEGEGSEDTSELSDDALKVYNERVGKSYKSWDDVTKREKEADKAFAKGIHKKEDKKETVTESVNDEVIEELLLTKHPEAENVLDELKDVAKQTGKSVLKLYRESRYFQGEAKTLADEKKQKEEIKSKITKPTQGATHSKQDISKTKPEDVANLKPNEKIAWLKEQARKEREAIE